MPQAAHWVDENFETQIPDEGQSEDRDRSVALQKGERHSVPEPPDYMAINQTIEKARLSAGVPILSTLEKDKCASILVDLSEYFSGAALTWTPSPLTYHSGVHGRGPRIEPQQNAYGAHLSNEWMAERHYRQRLDRLERLVQELSERLGQTNEEEPEFLGYPKSLAEGLKPLVLKRVGRTESTHLYFDDDEEG